MALRRVYFVDHYDSFSFNLIEWLRQYLPTVDIIRLPYDHHSIHDMVMKIPAPTVFSPGPKSPQEASSSVELCSNTLGIVPVLGICLGHQILGQVLGGQIQKSGGPFHGSLRKIQIRPHSSVFNSHELYAATYNSLCIARGSIPERYVTGVNRLEEIEVIERLDLRYGAVGVQFHPESFLSKSVEELGAWWADEVERFFGDKEAKAAISSTLAYDDQDCAIAPLPMPS